MILERKNSSSTRQKLLAAACEIFAIHGYRDTTIAAICKKARANIAAVNYHFGGKRTLYVEAWRYGFNESMADHPADGGVAESAPPEERLKGLVSALLHRIADEKNWEFLIARKERIHPTGLLNEVMRRDLHPLRKRMEGVVRSLLGPEVSEQQVFLCVFSILTLCIDPMAIRRGEGGNHDSRAMQQAVGEIELYARHVVNFCLAGMSAVRAEAEANKHDR